MSNLLEKASILLTPTAYDDGKVLSVKPEDGTGDFTFTRNSSATRVNSQGLIEDVQTLSSNLVSNGDFSQEGAELVTNGDFSVSTGWQGLNADRVISDGKLNISQASGFGVVYQPETLIVGTYYKCVVEVSNYVDGSFEIGLAGSDYANSSPSINADGTFTFYLQRLSGGSNNVGFIFSGLANLSIDNFSVKEVGQDWTLGTGWSIGDSVANAVDAAFNSQLAYSDNVVANTKYKVSFNVSNYVKGNVRVSIGNAASDTVSSNGNFTFVLTSANVAPLIIQSWAGGSGTSLSVTNISVIEITDDTNLPRIDYSPYSGAGTCGHWLFEPQSTNFITYSEDFSQWSVSNSTIVSNSVISPNGIQNATTWNVNTTSAKIQKPTSGLITAQQYTFSIYIKADAAMNIGITYDTGTATNIAVTTEWQRYEVTQTASSTTRYPQLKYNGDLGTAYIWGAQLEQQSFATSYIPTNGSTVTRLQDAAFGAGSSDLINSTEGVLYAEISALADDLSFRVLSLSDGTNNNTVKFGYRSDSNKIYSEFRTASTSQSFMSFDVSDITEFNKVAFKYKENDFALWINGVERATDASGTVPNIGTFNTLNFNRGDVNNVFFGKTKCVAVYKEALTDAELTCLTTI